MPLGPASQRGWRSPRTGRAPRTKQTRGRPSCRQTADKAVGRSGCVRVAARRRHRGQGRANHHMSETVWGDCHLKITSSSHIITVGLGHRSGAHGEGVPCHSAKHVLLRTHPALDTLCSRITYFHYVMAALRPIHECVPERNLMNQQIPWG